MPRRQTLTSFHPVHLDPAAGQALHRQLYDEIRVAILSGRLSPGARLPATREMAQQTQLARNTVLAAYEQLLAEGYLQSRVGSGTFVAADIPDLATPEAPAAPDLPAAPGPRRLSRRGETIMSLGEVPHRPAPAALALRPGLPALDEFPIDAWRRIHDRALRHPELRLMAYGEVQGLPELREAIADHLSGMRGARLSADQVMVVSGSQQAMDLCARVLTDPGDAVWVEDPGYFAAHRALRAAGAMLVPVPVDDEGMQVEEGVRRGPEARVVHVTPSHQNPSGVTLSLARRMALLRWAEQAGAWVIEDDNASEYRYRGRPLAALQGIDTSDRVLYAGTFSKVMFPGMRLGYLVAPRELVPALVQARELSDRQSAALPQWVMAQFMREGHFPRHLRRMRTLYAERLEALLAAVGRHGDDVFETSRGEGGMSRVLWLAPGIDERALVAAARTEGLHPMAMTAYRHTPSRAGIVVGFTAVPPGALEDAIRRLAVLARGIRG